MACFALLSVVSWPVLALLQADSAVVDSAGGMAQSSFARPAEGESVCCCSGEEPAKFVCIAPGEEEVLLPVVGNAAGGYTPTIPSNAEMVERKMRVTTTVLGECDTDGNAIIFNADQQMDPEEKFITVNQYRLRSGDESSAMKWAKYALPDDPTMVKKSTLGLGGYKYASKEHVITDDDVIYRAVGTGEAELTKPEAFGEGSAHCTNAVRVPALSAVKTKRLKSPTNETAWTATTKCELQTVCLQYSFGHACGWDQPRGQLYKRTARAGTCQPAIKDGTCPLKSSFSKKQPTGSFGYGGFRWCDCRAWAAAAEFGSPVRSGNNLCPYGK